MKKKIAFIYYPHSTDAARLETMPVALNSVSALAKSGWAVDLFLWEEKSKHYEELFPDNVKIRYLKDLPGNDSRIILLRQILFLARFLHRYRYRCVFGIGQIGAYVASIVSRSSNCPFVYMNDEYPSQWFESRWARLEREAANRASLWIVPDYQRFEPLCAELGSDSSIPHTELPNIPIVKQPLEKIDWHGELGLPEGSVPFLHAGSLADWAQVPEILISLPQWSSDAVLVLHSRDRNAGEAYRKQLSHIDVPGRVFWNFEPLKEDRLNSLVAYCSGNFGLYRNLGTNIEHMGFSSGKIMRSLACGTPVIASDFSSLSFISEHELGVLVKHPSEIPDAVKAIKEHVSEYRERCRLFCETKVSFEMAWKEFCEKLDHYAHLNLLRSDL
jgi:glycosyltransferase involved in cell wall biosynthesis